MTFKTISIYDSFIYDISVCETNFFLSLSILNHYLIFTINFIVLIKKKKTDNFNI